MHTPSPDWMNKSEKSEYQNKENSQEVVEIATLQHMH